MEGYIKLHRQIVENEFWLSERFTKSQAWTDLLLLATYKDRTVFIRGVEINLKPGELCYAQTTLAKRWRWNRKTVDKFLSLLKKRKMLDTKITNVTTIISIDNWGLYQSDGQQTGQQKDTKTGTNEKVNKVKNNNANSFSIKFLPEGLNGELFYKNKFFFITQTLKTELLERFSNKALTEDILKNEFYKMEVWLESNRAKKNYKLFIVNWLTKVSVPTTFPGPRSNQEITFKEA